MALSFDLYWSFRSPYSYLATGRIVALRQEWDVEVRVKPVLPLAVRTPEFFEQVNPLWPPYLLRDTFRIAQFLGIDYGWPRPDPVVQDFVNRRIPKEQPYAHRLTRIGVEAARLGRGLELIDEVSRVIWSGKIDGWDQGTHLADAVARAGLDLADLERRIAEDPADRDREIDQNQKDLEAAGHWGVPTMVFEGEPFFGQDRIDLLRWRLEQRGLRQRSA